MADLRVLKLALLAETKDFINGLDKATAESKTFSQKLSKTLKAGALAFAALGAAAGAAAIKIGKDAVEAAIADEESQVKLRKALQNSTKATDAQVKATEDYIRKTQFATGVSDSQLRPALANLARATGDLTKAQELNTLAVDISTATGKDLETISLALSKAYDGNLGALTRLGVPLDENIIRTKDFDAATRELEKLFGGSAAAAADTYAGRLRIIQERIGEAKEELGEALLPVLDTVSKFIESEVVPAFEGLIRALTGGPRSVKGQTKEANSAFAELGIVFNENDQAGYDLGLALRNLGESFAKLFDDVNAGTGPEGAFARFIQDTANVVNGISRLIDAIDRGIDKYNELNRVVSKIPGLGGFGESQAILAQSPQLSPGAAARLNPQININIKGVTDKQGVAREVVKTLNTAQKTTGAGLSRLLK